MSKSALAILGGLLGIICGEALKLGYTDWMQMTGLQYWMGVGVQVASLIAVYTGGLYQNSPGGLDEHQVTLKKLDEELGKD